MCPVGRASGERLQVWAQFFPRLFNFGYARSPIASSAVCFPLFQPIRTPVYRFGAAAFTAKTKILRRTVGMRSFQSIGIVVKVGYGHGRSVGVRVTREPALRQLMGDKAF